MTVISKKPGKLFIIIIKDKITNSETVKFVLKNFFKVLKV